MRYSLDPPTHLNGHPTNCHWCGGRLDKLRNIFKGQGCSRYYDSESCLIRGEQRAAQSRHAELEKIAGLAGTVHMHWTATLAAALSVLMLAFIFTGGTKAWAHDPLTHQANGYSAAKNKANGLCCDGDDYTYINPYAWERTATGFRVRVNGQWVDVPADAEVGNMKNPDGEAKVWLYYDNTGPKVRCLMPGIES